MSTEQSESDKYLSFALDEGHFAVQILRIREIIAMHAITPLPRLDPEVRGVINLRGKIIPVIDLRMKLGLTAAAYDRSTCIVVFDVELENGAPGNVGCIVDSVNEVIDLVPDQIQDPPNVVGEAGAEFVHGLCKLESSEKVMSILDMEVLLASLAGQAEAADLQGAGQ